MDEKDAKGKRHKAKSRIESFYDLKEKRLADRKRRAININVNISRMGRKILEIKNVAKSLVIM